VLHLPSTATVIPIGADTQNRLRAFLPVIPLDLFALIRSRSTGGEFPHGIRPVSL